MTLRFTAAAVLCLTAPATAGSHLWVINEIYSNADGTIQFIEMKESMGATNEIFIGGKWVRSDATGNTFTFPSNLPAGTTANKHLLLATAGFAALPGAPTPDYIIQDSFFDISADTIRYWTYATSPLTFGAGDLPADCVISVHRNGPGATDITTGPNTPTNYHDSTATIVAPWAPEDLDADGLVGILDFLQLLAAWGPCAGCPEDLDGDSTVGILDFLALLAAWGPCS